MALEFKKARRSQARIKICMGGASGSGKTMSSLLLAYGLIKAEHPELTDAECWDKICIIDTENGSGGLYVNTPVGSTRIGEYNAIQLSPPYEASKYIDAIHLAEENGMYALIIDSLSHAWSGEGGALDKQGKIAARTGNSYTAWRDVTPEHNRLVDTMLQSNCHVIAAIRAKTDYVQQKDDRGKTVVKNVGMGLVMRDGIEYEFTVSFMLDSEHIANATKDRTGIFDGKYFTIDPSTGADIYQWLSSGSPEPVKKNAPVIQKASATVSNNEEVNQAGDDAAQLENARNLVDKVVKARCQGISAQEKQQVIAEIKALTGGTANYMAVTDVNVLREIYKKYKEYVNE